MAIEAERLATVFLIALVFAPLEFLIPATMRPRFSWKRYRTDILHVAIGGLVIRLGTTALVASLLSLISLPSIGTKLPIAYQIVGVLVISDLGFYLAHRLCHAVPILWEFHKIHHSSEHLDWLASYRVHPFDQIFNSTMIALPALSLGFSPIAIVTYAIAYQWHSILLHSNVKLSLGPLERIVATPRFHHWHHANEKEAYDRNFGGQLVIWDRIFGTSIIKSREPVSVGVINPPSESFISHMVGPFTQWKRNAKPD